jgi:hypothetical protein
VKLTSGFTEGKAVQATVLVWTGWKREESLRMPENEFQFGDHPVRSLVAVLTELHIIINCTITTYAYAENTPGTYAYCTP